MMDGSSQTALGFGPVELTLGQKIWSINWGLLLLVL